NDGTRAESDDVVVHFKPGTILPLGVGRLIAARVLVVSRDEYPALRDSGSVEAVYDNRTIAFSLDNPIGGAGVVENDDNWGVGPSGYAAAGFGNSGSIGSNVRVGIADSGQDATHPAFAKLVSDGRLSAFAAFNRDGNKVVQHTPNGAVIPD